MVWRACLFAHFAVWSCIRCFSMQSILVSRGSARDPGRKQLPLLKKDLFDISSEVSWCGLWNASSAHQHIVSLGVINHRRFYTELCAGHTNDVPQATELTLGHHGLYAATVCSTNTLCATLCPSMWCQGCSGEILFGRSPGFSSETHIHKKVWWWTQASAYFGQLRRMVFKNRPSESTPKC